MIKSGDIQWPMVSAIAASIGVIVALIFYVLNLKITRLSNSAKMVLDLRNVFNSAEMRRYRRDFAKMLLNERSSVDLRKNVPVPEFFEQIGYMTKRKVLDESMVWNSFSWWLELYYLALTEDPDLIAKARCQSKSPTLFREIEWVYGRMCEIDMREEDEEKHTPPSADDVREFLNEESKLDLEQI